MNHESVINVIYGIVILINTYFVFYIDDWKKAR